MTSVTVAFEVEKNLEGVDAYVYDFPGGRYNP